jgi:hypothetical protein
MNYISAITGAVNMLAGGVEGGILGSGNLPPPPVVVQPAPNYTPYYVLGFASLIGIVLYK